METSISEVTKNTSKSMQEIRGLVKNVIQTTGPTLFAVTDGSGSLMVKAFNGAGVRAYPEIMKGDCIKALITIKEFNNELEGECIKMSKLNEAEGQQLGKKIEEMQRKRAQVESPPAFMVKSQILDRLKDSFIKAAVEIRLAIIKSRPIIVRHHNDSDGYSSGYTLERAILPLIQKQHGTDKSKWQFYTRAPSMAPFYEIEDSIKDTANSLRDVAKFSEDMPLVIIADTGSSEESLMAIKQGKIHGSDFIVIDHHFFEKDVISKEVLVHINPFLVGEDGAKFSAGMLCSEFARFVNPEISIEQIPAMAGMADMIDNSEVMTAYFKIAEKKGYSKELLHEISSVIDFVSTKLRFMEAREYVEVLFGEDIEHQKKLIALLAPHINTLEAKALAIAKGAVKQEKLGAVMLQTVEIEQTFSRNAYPKPGKCIGMVHDVAKDKNKRLVTVGVMSDMMTMRATADSGFSVHDFIEHVGKNLSQAFAEGGGHHQAGTIKFVPSQQKQVVEELKKFLKNLK